MDQRQRPKKIKIVWIYQDLLNLYGDRGNILTLMYRARARGIEVALTGASLGQPIDQEANLIFIGGGQDQEQEIVSRDLSSKSKFLHEFIREGGPLLAICGGYQLLGEYYETGSGKKIQGAGVLPIHTKASTDRMIGDLVANISLAGQEHTLIGFENHSGKTFLSGVEALGQVKLGFGNNGQDKTAGLKYHNAIGTYAHGPLLPKNPFIADFLLTRALRYNGYRDALGPINDPHYKQIVEIARSQAIYRAGHRKKGGLGLKS